MIEPNKLSFSTDLNLLIDKYKEDEIPVIDILEELTYRSHAIFILLLSVPFVLPMPIMGLSTLFGLLMMVSAISIIFGSKPWLPKRWRNRKIPRESLVKMAAKLEKATSYLEKVIRPRYFFMFKSPHLIRFHGLAIFIAAFILALPSPPGGNILPGMACMALALGLVEEDGVFLILGYVLTALNILLVTLILVYGLDWLMSFFA